MWRNWTVLILGIIVFLLPFLGFPRAVDDKLLFLIGLVIIAVSYLNARFVYLLIRHVSPSEPQTLPPKPLPLETSTSPNEEVIAE